MATEYADLFGWYMIVITWSIVFIILVSIYLYAQSRKARKMDSTSYIKNFTIVWILISLLVLYIVSINRGSSTLFAVGNIVVEAYLLYYVMNNRTVQ
jgi:heme/copper-type cytochrome/quinol oxidase subunit 2